MVRKLNLGGYLASSLWPVESILGRLVLAEAYRWSTPGPDYEHSREDREGGERETGNLSVSQLLGLTLKGTQLFKRFSPRELRRVL